MKFTKVPGFFACCFLIAGLSSCATRIDGVVREGGAAELSFKTSLETRAEMLIRSLRTFMGGAANTPVLDGAALARSMAAAPGIRAVSVENTGPSALEGSISISNVGDFLALGDSKFVTFTEGPGNSSLVITLDRASGPQIISRLSPEAEEYLSALFAPAVTGEASTRQEYLDLVASVYGRPLADEIAAARIKVFLEFPRPVKAVRGGVSSGNRAEFDIPLLDILVLEQALRYELSW